MCVVGRFLLKTGTLNTYAKEAEALISLIDVSSIDDCLSCLFLAVFVYLYPMSTKKLS